MNLKTGFRLASLGAAAVLQASTCAGAWRDANRNGTMEPYEDPAQTVAARVDDLVSRMTPDEKAGQLNLPYWSPGKDNAAVERLIASGGVGGLLICSGTDPAKANELQRLACERSRLGVPVFNGQDIIHGASVTFPISPFLAGAFEPELFERAQAVAARDAAAEGITVMFAPMCDVARDLRWGRNAETCGEDPYLTSLCVAAAVRGIQGDDPSAPDRCVSCPKHFVGYSEGRGGRDYNESEIGDWTLQNAHLPPFRAAVDAGALAIMSNFTTIDGVPGCANRRTLTDVLRGQLGFTGLVMSDWDAVGQLVDWGIAADKAEAAERAVAAGNDMDMITGAYVAHLPEAVAAGRLPADVLDVAARRVLAVKFRLGLFERPYVETGLVARVRAADETAARALARDCVRKSAVLLKNEGALPLDAASLRRVALIGPFADDREEMIGCWGGRAQPERAVTLRAALEAELGTGRVASARGCAAKLTPPVKFLQDGTRVRDESAPPTDETFDAEKALAAAKGADAVILAVGETRDWTGENASRRALGLTGRQQELFDRLVAEGIRPVVIVFSGRPLILPAVWEKSAAVLYAGQPGSEAGNGLADLLFGRTSPSGRLTMSVPENVGELPAYYNRCNTGRPRSGGYRDKDDSSADHSVRFPFGFGLTYGDVGYSPCAVSGDTVRATVTNRGGRPVVETVQLYVTACVCRAGARPERELRGFRRVSLKPGESREVVFRLTDETLGYRTRDGRFACDAGRYLVRIAPHAAAGEPQVFECRGGLR